MSDPNLYCAKHYPRAKAVRAEADGTVIIETYTPEELDAYPCRCDLVRAQQIR